MEIRSYLLPTLLATLLHLIVLGGLLTQWIGEREPERRMPRHIQAKMIDLDALGPVSAPQSRPVQDNTQKQEQARQAAVQKAAQERAQQQARQVAERQAAEKKATEKKLAEQKAAEKKLAEQKAAAEVKRKQDEALALKRKTEAEAKRKAEDKRKAEEQRLAQAKQQEREKAAAKAKADAAAKAKAAADAKAKAVADAKATAAREQQRQAAVRQAESVVGDIQSYIQALLQDNWRIPGTARNGMEAIVSIRLLGNGEIDQANIYKSSGDAAFDRSVLQAVQRTERFERVAQVDPLLFERRLRTIQVVFRPEGLRW